VITEIILDQLREIRKRVHPGCVVCSEGNRQGLKLDFSVSDDGVVSADFIFDKVLEGYPGMLHGGILSAILDGAMTNCLLAHDRVAVTADFRVRFRHPVATDQAARVQARITLSRPPLYDLKAEIIQDGQVKITATGKFMEQPQLRMSLEV